jgi:hypothetical protein
MTYRTFLLHHGYHEDQSLACLPLTHEDGFKSPREAMEAFRELLLVYWREQNTPKGCCSNAPAGANFCPACGTEVDTVEEQEDIEALGVAGLFMDLFTGTTDNQAQFLRHLDETASPWSLAPDHTAGTPVHIVGVARWLDDESYMEAELPDGTYWNSRSEEEKPVPVPPLSLV